MIDKTEFAKSILATGYCGMIESCDGCPFYDECDGNNYVGVAKEYLEESMKTEQELYQKMQKMWVEFHGVEVGDVVKFTSSWKDGQGGFGSSGCELNHKTFIGDEVNITDMYDNSIATSSSGSDWGRYECPFFCLEYIGKAKQVDITITMNGEKVDPKTISKETWENLRK